MNRFVFRKDSGLEFSFQGTLGLYNLEKAYDLQATVSATNTRYRGGLEVCPGGCPSGDGPAGADQCDDCGFQRKLPVFRRIVRRPFGMHAQGQEHRFPFCAGYGGSAWSGGQAYPGYTLRMFSDSAARVLKEFVFTRPVTLSGGGMFPMGMT